MNHDESLAIRFGPLRYLLLAHDARSSQELAAMREDLHCAAFDGEPDRVVHVVATERTGSFAGPIAKGKLPSAVTGAVAESLPEDGWSLTWRESDWMAWHHPFCRSALWVWTGTGADEAGHYQLPWASLQLDIETLGGSLCHGALATTTSGAGVLLLAPPDGGKTTTSNRLPSDWTVLGDDLCLVWPSAGRHGKRWSASTLPSWGWLLRRSEKPARVDRWRVGETCELAGLFVLRKRPSVALVDLAPVRAAGELYRSLLEHPQVIPNDPASRVGAFGTACMMARGIRAHDLWISRNDDLAAVLRAIE